MDNDSFLHKQTSFQKFLTLLLIVTSSFFLITMLGLLVAVPIFGKDVMKNLENLSNPDNIPLINYFQFVSQCAFFIIPSLLFAFLDGGNIFHYLKLNVKPLLICTIIAILIVFSANPLINFLSEWNQQLQLPSFMSGIEQWIRESEDKATQLTDLFLSNTSMSGLLANIFIIALIPAFFEEFIFRGILQKLFHQWTKNIHVAVFLSAFLFSLIHFQFFGFLPRFLIGVLLGYLFAWSGSLWTSILVHFVNNFSAVMLTFLMKRNIINNSFETIGTGDSALLPVLGSVILTALLIYLFFYFQKKNKKSLSNERLFTK